MSEKKKISTPVFMIVATLVNIALIILFCVILTALLGVLASHVQLSDTVYSVLTALDLILSFVLSLLVYRKLVAIAAEKWDIGGKGSDPRRR